MDTLVTFSGVTVTLAVELTPWELAVMVAVPVETPMTRPPGDVTVATLVAELVQPTWSPEIVFWLPSEYLAVAVSWTVLPAEIVAAEGVMKIELMEGLIKKPEQLPMLTQSTKANPVVITTRMVPATRTTFLDNAIR
jgi:hypothetical protein